MNNVSLFKTGYDRDHCSIGIVHLGYGSFHRAHQAVYIDDVMDQTGDLGWGIAAVNLRSSESDVFHDAARAKDGYVVKTIAPDGAETFRLVRAHLDFIDAPSQPEEAFDVVSSDGVKMITITVTESGYYLDQNGALNLEEEAIRNALSGAPSDTVYAYLAEALGRRARRINLPITILCCDNMRSNGRVLKNALLAYIHATGDATLAQWVEDKVSFPCSMVDRITPKSTPDLADEIKAHFPEYAVAPVHAETYLQWVIEGDFANGMPDLVKAGVQIVAEVEPFEEAKIRILNGGHSGLAYLGVLAGHQTFDEAMRDPLLEKHFDKFESEEVLPGLGNAIPFDTSLYLQEIAARFENSGIADNLERICMDGYSKMAIYIRPTMEACLEKGIIPEASFDTIASWIVYARRCRDGVSSVPYHEPYWDRLAPMIEKGQEAQVASDPNIWGDLPQRFESFVPGVISAIQRMDEKWQA